MPYIPNDYLEFRDVFVGGGSIFLAAKQQKNIKAKYVICDINFDLICFWRELQAHPEELREAVLWERDSITEGKKLYDFYLNYNPSNNFERAIRYYVLNRISFSGLVDTGGYSKGSFEGRFTDSIIDRLVKVSNLIKNIEIVYGDYEQILFKPGENVFIFLDPPYFSYSIKKLYGKKGKIHIEFDHERLAKNLKKCKHKWLMTYDDHKVIRDYYSSFSNIKKWSLKYGMSNKKGENGSKLGNELIISNFTI